jgi:dienelactone hydrolase
MGKPLTRGWFHAVLCASVVGAISFAETTSSAPVFSGAEKVDFDSAAYTYPPSPFKVKQAKKLGIPVKTNAEPSIPLTGYLARPEGEEPRAAIVLLHSCAGITRHAAMWSDRFVDSGYVVLSVDSFTLRGFDYNCDNRAGAKITPWLRALDAYGAKRYLSSRPFVDPARIAVFGMSHGGMTVLEVIKQSTSEGLEVKPFQAAIALYPLCNQPERINTPTLILAGEMDTWHPAKSCAQYVAKVQPQQNINLRVFAEAYHGFDLVGLDIVEVGHIVRFSPEAAAETIELTRKFLEERL